MVVIDANGKILGRMATKAAQQLKDGEDVHIINAERAVVTGRREDVFEKYRAKQEIGNRDHGPYYPKAPERMVKRTVEGMLPKSNDGRDMVKQLKTYNGNPEGFDADENGIKSVTDLQGSEYVSMQEISAHM